MKQESPTTLDIGIQQHKQFIDTPKDVTKSNKNVKDTTAAKELDDMPNKELLSKISETLAEFYGGGKDYDESEEAQKERPRSCAKAENSSELSFHEGDILLVQCRQYDGWLMANLGEETGLIPENYLSENTFVKS
ncbi:9912_t:CDS:2 [Rhizophagus irregularis]|nr:9912_t:CDS:2 [Rhizophagus irregularis]